MCNLERFPSQLMFASARLATPITRNYFPAIIIHNHAQLMHVSDNEPKLHSLYKYQNPLKILMSLISMIVA